MSKEVMHISRDNLSHKLLLTRQGFIFAIPLLLWSLFQSAACQANNIEEQNGKIVIEAEHFSSQHLDEKRRWLVFPQSQETGPYADPDLPHVKGASNNAYIELLPDTRTNHFEKLIKGENFSNVPGKVAILTYPIHVQTPGKYYVWARAFSTGTEDNGIHIGLNGAWPESGQRLQLCDGKHRWTWSSAQRVPDNHCGTPNTISIDIASAGVHSLTVSMREDGFELDKLLLTQDKDYKPTGIDLAATVTSQPALEKKSQLLGIEQYSRILQATTDFVIEDTGEVPYYIHKQETALAIDATKEHYRDRFAYAEYQVESRQTGTFDLTLVTLTEIDGESNYQVWKNDTLLAEFTNPETEADYQEAYFHLPGVQLSANDVLKVASNAVTNGKIPENGGTAFARGRWRAVVLYKARDK